MAPEAFFEVGGRASAGWYSSSSSSSAAAARAAGWYSSSSSSSSSSAAAARAARWGVLVVGGAAGSAVAAAAAERETLLVGGAGRGFLFLLREAGAEDIAAVGLAVLGACLDLVFLRFYPKDWTLFTFSGVSGCLRHYSVATRIRGVGVITKGSRHGPT